jgi:hypothetical protein
LGNLDAAGGGMVAPVKREAERLVREHWDTIERVAEALSERGELSGDEVDALIEWTLASDPKGRRPRRG